MNYKDFYKEDMLPGGCGDKTSTSTIDPTELSNGIKVEMEHTKNAKIAKEIAIDHLTESPHYYKILKQSGLMGKIDESSVDSTLMGIESHLPDFTNKNTGIKEPNTATVIKQTTPVTVFPTVNLKKQTNIVGCGGIGNTTDFKSPDKSDVDSPAKDPTQTDHITGGIGSTPVNTNILSKSPTTPIGINLQSVQQSMVGDNEFQNPVIPKDISIDIDECKTLLKKMIGDLTLVPSKKRWTVKWKQ